MHGISITKSISDRSHKSFIVFIMLDNLVRKITISSATGNCLKKGCSETVSRYPKYHVWLNHARPNLMHQLGKSFVIPLYESWWTSKREVVCQQAIVQRWRFWSGRRSHLHWLSVVWFTFRSGKWVWKVVAFCIISLKSVLIPISEHCLSFYCLQVHGWSDFCSTLLFEKLEPPSCCKHDI